MTLLISLLFNFGFLLLGGILLSRKDRMNYLRGKLAAAVLVKPTILVKPTQWRSPYYLHRQQQFELLRISSNSIIFLGDSITNEGEWSEWFSQHRVHNRGISGDTIVGVIDRLDAVLTPPPSKLFLMIGINDLISGALIEMLVQNYHQLLADIHAKTPDTAVFVQSILPIHPQLCGTALSNEAIATVNEKLQAIAQQFADSYIDLFATFCDDRKWLDRQYTLDGLH